jgi:hypothetical protein
VFFAQSYFAANEAIASVLGDERQHPGCEPVRLRPLSGLPAQFLATRLGSRDAGADTFRRQPRSNSAIPASTVAVMRP